MLTVEPFSPIHHAVARYRYGNSEGSCVVRHRAQQWACDTRGATPSPPSVATTREELAAAAIACEGRVWYQNATQKPRARQGAVHS